MNIGDKVKLVLPPDAHKWNNWAPSLREHDSKELTVSSVYTHDLYGPSVRFVEVTNRSFKLEWCQPLSGKYGQSGIGWKREGDMIFIGTTSVATTAAECEAFIVFASAFPVPILAVFKRLEETGWNRDGNGYEGWKKKLFIKNETVEHRDTYDTRHTLRTAADVDAYNLLYGTGSK